jgi:hypothetical protein
MLADTSPGRSIGRDEGAVELSQISAGLVESLGLGRPPVALAFASERPPGVSLAPNAVPLCAASGARQNEESSTQLLTTTSTAR